MGVTIYLMTPAGPTPRGWKRELGYYAVDEANGEVYLPAQAASGPSFVFLCAAYDGTPCAQTEDGVTLYPATWLAREFPESAEAITAIVARIRNALAHPTRTGGEPCE